MIILPEIHPLCGHADISCMSINLIRMIWACCVLICSCCSYVRLVIVLFLYLTDRMDAAHMGCWERTCGYRAAASVRRGEYRGGRWGNIDDSLLHGCLISFLVRILIFCRIEIRNPNRQTKVCTLLLSYAYWTDKTVDIVWWMWIEFHAVACSLSVCLLPYCPSDPNFNPNYLALLSCYSEWLAFLEFRLELHCLISDWKTSSEMQLIAFMIFMKWTRKEI